MFDDGRRTHDNTIEIGIMYKKVRKYSYCFFFFFFFFFFITADGSIPDSYVTIQNKGTRVLRSINPMGPNVEHIVYSLFFPRGS